MVTGYQVFVEKLQTWLQKLFLDYGVKYHAITHTIQFNHPYYMITYEYIHKDRNNVVDKNLRCEFLANSLPFKSFNL